jgi:hypothetical protein
MTTDSNTSFFVNAQPAGLGSCTHADELLHRDQRTRSPVHRHGHRGQRLERVVQRVLRNRPRPMGESAGRTGWGDSQIRAWADFVHVLQSR